MHKKAIDILNAAKKRNNHEIEKIVGIHHTTVSAVLSRAKKFGYVEKKEGKWIKTKEIKGIDLYRMAKVKFTSSLNPNKGFAKSGIKFINPLKPLSYFKEATEMMESYRAIFCLENTIRDFLRSVFKNEKDWLTKRIDVDIRNDIERAKKEPYYAHKKRKDDLDYATLGHLLKIIISKMNWKDILPRLNENDKNKFIATFERVLPSRNATAHCVVLDSSDRKLIESRVREITMMFKL